MGLGSLYAGRAGMVDESRVVVALAAIDDGAMGQAEQGGVAIDVFIQLGSLALEDALLGVAAKLNPASMRRWRGRCRRRP